MEFDDFVYDKHTRKGPRDIGYFIHITSKVSNEVNVIPHIFKRLYEYEGQKPEDTKKETDYELIVRCQLVTSAHKTDSVLAISPDTGDMVFLKGPFKDAKPARDFIYFQNEKKQRGLPYICARQVNLVPNRWAATPIGVRNHLDLSVSHPFLETASVICGDQVEVKVHKSTLWPETQVLDTKFCAVNPLNLSGRALEEYISHIKFRIEFNLGDLADRNFLKGYDGHIYSVDEEVTSAKIDLEKQLKKARYELVKSYL
jgi:hypothetical protein